MQRLLPLDQRKTYTLQAHFHDDIWGYYYCQNGERHSEQVPIGGYVQGQLAGIMNAIQGLVEPGEDVFVAYCPELPGCVTCGKTEEEAYNDILEALELYLRPSKEELVKNANFMRLPFSGGKTASCYCR